MKARPLALAAVFTALTAILAQVTLPIGPVPVNSAHVSLFTASALLGPKISFLSTFAYILLGAIGLPVFSGFNGGLGALFGPTGGFIFGYLVCSLLGAQLIKTTKKLALPMVLALVANYLLGIPWLMFVTGMGLSNAILIGVLPFLLGDAFKIFISVILVRKLRKLIVS
ncbi:MAG: biotin transporter BioY [Turicibacter sp.]|nr:biotin transporter BioY [Turicibacter sp.]